MPDPHVSLASRYRLEEPIAGGGFGEVWRGTDVTLGRTVAIKLLRPACGQDPVALARFRAEARHAAALCHPNIAAIHDFCEPAPPEAAFLVMEYVTGPSLEALLADGPIRTASAMSMIADAAAGLAAAHQAGLVHRDIKPSNLLFSRDGRVKITDFGIAHAAGSAPLTATGVLMGTPAYMAPERVVGARGSPASDIYSLGVVAYHAVTGAIPFAGTPLEVAMAHRERPMPPVPESVPPEVTAFIMQLTAKDPAARPAHASEVALRASRLCEHLTDGPADIARGATAPGPRTGPGRYWPGRYRRRAAIAAAAVAGVLLGLHLAGARIGATPSAAQAMPPMPTDIRSSAPKVAAAQTVEVKASSLVGEQVAVAARQLHALGLSVVIIWPPANGKTPGTVLSVRPGGRVTVGSRITLDVARGTAALQVSPERATPPPDHSPRHGTPPGKEGPQKGHKPDHGDGSDHDNGTSPPL